MGPPSLRGRAGASALLSIQRLKVVRSAARWVFVVTTILDSFRMCYLVKSAHYANKPSKRVSPTGISERYGNHVEIQHVFGERNLLSSSCSANHVLGERVLTIALQAKN